LLPPFHREFGQGSLYYRIFHDCRDLGDLVIHTLGQLERAFFHLQPELIPISGIVHHMVGISENDRATYIFRDNTKFEGEDAAYSLIKLHTARG
jgi:hypothetical protein